MWFPKYSTHSCVAWILLLLLPTRVLGLLNQQKLTRGQTRNPGAALSGPWCSGRTRTETASAALSPGGASWFLIWSEGGGESGGRARGVAWVARPPLVGVAWRGMHSALLLRLASQKWQLLKGIKDLDNWRNIPCLGIGKTQYPQNHNSP